jgi:DNA polymerase-3 subunit epsilon
MLVERGNFWGMGYIPADETPGQLEKIKEILEPYPDNDFIRNSIYSFADAHPYKRVNFS